MSIMTIEKLCNNVYCDKEFDNNKNKYTVIYKQNESILPIVDSCEESYFYNIYQLFI